MTWLLLIFGFANGMISSGFSSSLPIMYSKIITSLSNEEDIGIDTMILSYISYKILTSATASLRGGSFTYFIHCVTKNTKMNILDIIRNLKMSYYDKNSKTEIGELITVHSDKVSELFLLNSNIAVRTLTQSIITYVITANISLNLSGLLIVLCFIQISVQTYYHDFIYGKIVNILNVAQTDQNKITNDYIQYVDTYKASGLERKFYEEFEVFQNKITNLKQKESFHYTLNMFISDSVNTFIIFVLLFYSIYLDNIPRKDIHIFLLYIDTYMNIMGSIKHIYNTFVNHKDSYKKITDFSRENKNIERFYYIPSKLFDPVIHFDNICFSYGDKPVLKDFCLDIPFGSKIGFFGKSGIGKSTILKLLLKLYDVDKGVITIDDKNVKYFDNDWYYENAISYVGQENPILIKDKIDEPVMTHLQKMFLKDIDIDSSKMSGGQKQRLSIYKCLLKNSPIILMDEPTSSLDEDNKNLFIEVMKEHVLTKDFTLILVSHDEYLITKLCDNIIKL